MAFLNYEGLKRYDKKTKEYIKDKIIEASLNGGTVDLSTYATKEDLKNKVDKIEGKSLISDVEIERLKNVDNYDDTDIKRSINAKANTTDLTAHTDDTGIHITSAERTKWNNKAETSDIPNLTNYATKTYVTDEIAKASTITDNRYNEIVNYIFGGE